MTSTKIIARANLKERREKLKRRRKIEFWQATWRILVLTGISGGLGWNFLLPNWTIQQESQIEVRGNQYLTSTAIKKLLDIPYPQSILQVSPKELMGQLEKNGSIDRASITRQLVPPSLTVSVTERPPVAIALSSEAKLDGAGTYSKEIGFLDEKGIWMPKASYKMLPGNLSETALKITGLPSVYLPYWQEIYLQIEGASLEIYELDWQDPNNLILKTELGKVYLGPYYTSQFSEQLSVLSKMKNLPEQIPPVRIAYINLSDPKAPKIQLHSP